MMNNGYGFNNGYQPTGGYYGGMMYQQAPKLNMTQGLSPDQIKSLRKTGGFNLEITEEELLRAYCAHRNETSFTVVPNDEGRMICHLCGTEFMPFEGSTEEARALVNRVVDLLETTKMRAISLPPKVIQDMFQITPMIKRLPDLYSQSLNDVKRAMGTNDQYVMGQETNAFAAYQSMLNPMAGAGYYDPAMAQPQMQQPVYGAQQPMGQPMYGGMQQTQPMYAPQQPMQQPMYGNMPQQSYQPYGQPMQQAPQGNPFDAGQGQQPQQQPNQGDQVTVTKTLTD